MPSLPFTAPPADQLILGKIVGAGILKPKHLTISIQERSAHTFILGRTGRGKSKLLQHAIVSDIERGRGVAVLDPHGDLISESLATLYKRGFFAKPHNSERIIYINPGSDYVTPMNILATTQRPTEEEISSIAGEVITILKRAWEDALSSAANFEDITRSGISLLAKTGKTLLDYPRLFAGDTAFRDNLLEQADDRKLDEFFGRMDEMSKSSSADRKESSVNKLNPLRLIPHIELAIGQKQNWMQFRKWMDESYVVLLNLGGLEPNSAEERFFGNVFTRGFEKAAFSRSDMLLADRLSARFFIYIDEFQNFSSTSSKAFSSILSGARKFGLHMTLATQYLEQIQKAELLEAIFGNVATKIFFATSEFDAIKLAKAVGLGHLDTTAIKEEAKTQTQHHVYEPLTEQENKVATSLSTQPRRRALVRTELGHNYTIETLDMPDIDPLPEHIFNQVIKPYGIPRSEARKNINQLYEEVQTPKMSIEEASDYSN